MSRKKLKCKACGGEISSKVCVNCGKKYRKPFYKKWWIWFIIIVFALAFIGNNIDDEDLDSTDDVSKQSAISTTQGDTLKEISSDTASSVVTTTRKTFSTTEPVKYATYKHDGKEYYSFENSLNAGTVIYLNDGEQIIPYLQIIKFGENKQNNGGTVIKNAVYVKELYSVLGEEFTETLWRDLDDMIAYNAETLEETGEPVYYVLAE